MAKKPKRDALEAVVVKHNLTKEEEKRLKHANLFDFRLDTPLQNKGWCKFYANEVPVYWSYMDLVRRKIDNRYTARYLAKSRLAKARGKEYKKSPYTDVKVQQYHVGELGTPPGDLLKRVIQLIVRPQTKDYRFRLHVRFRYPNNSDKDRDKEVAHLDFTLGHEDTNIPAYTKLVITPEDIRLMFPVIIEEGKQYVYDGIQAQWNYPRNTYMGEMTYQHAINWLWFDLNINYWLKENAPTFTGDINTPYPLGPRKANEFNRKALERINGKTLEEIIGKEGKATPYDIDLEADIDHFF